MKMNFKETALLLGLSMTVPATSIAQDKVEASVGADLVSGYIWRGQDLGGVSIQPSLSVAYKGFSPPPPAILVPLQPRHGTLLPCPQHFSLIYLVVSEENCNFVAYFKQSPETRRT